MQPERIITGTEREQLARITDLKEANSSGQSAATIVRLTQELTATREELEGVIAARVLLSKELEMVREQIAELECTVKLATEAANRAEEARLKLIIELENVENEKARIEADAPGGHATRQ